MFLPSRFYYAWFSVALLLLGGYLWSPLFTLGCVAWGMLLLAVSADLILLYGHGRIEAEREPGERFSNGDDNRVRIRLESHCPYTAQLEVIDEVPFVFQQRNTSIRLRMPARSNRLLSYTLRPTQRGSYTFGLVRVFLSSPIGLVVRRFTGGTPQTVKVYPSYRMLRKEELRVLQHPLAERGTKQVRRIGHQTAFEHIKDYVKGDDYRTINWKASARRHQLMVNVLQDERSQQVYSVIDKGRTMQQAFAGMTCLDYAINAALMLSYIAIHKDDQAGLVTFEKEPDTFLAATKQDGQMRALQEALYAQELRTP